MNLSIFSFPVNLIVGLVLLGAGALIPLIGTRKHLAIALALFALMCMVQGLVPMQMQFNRSIPFIVALLWLLFVLSSFVFHYPMSHGKGAFLIYAGLLVSLLSGGLGACDAYKVQTMAWRSEFSSVHPMPFSIRLENFRMETFPTGEPMNYTAVLTAQSHNEDKTQHKFTLQVNHPVTIEKHQIYLQGYDTQKGSDTPYCTLLVTYQPWRWLIFSGILIMLCGALVMFLRGLISSKKRLLP